METRQSMLIFFIQTSFLRLTLPSFPEPSPQTMGLRDAFSPHSGERELALRFLTRIPQIHVMWVHS